MTPTRGGPSVHQCTDNVCDSCQTIEALLPGGRDLVSAIVIEPFAVLPSEHRISVEGSQEGDVVSFHDHRHGDHSSLSAYNSGALVTFVLTERPHSSPLVCLEALYEPDAVLLRRGLHGTGVERFVVNVDILKVLEVLLGVLDMEVGLFIPLFGGHGALMQAAQSLAKCLAKMQRPGRNMSRNVSVLMRTSRVSHHWFDNSHLLSSNVQGLCSV